MPLIGTKASLSANAPDYSYPLPSVFIIEVFIYIDADGAHLLIVYTSGLRSLGCLAMGGMVGLGIFFFAFISGTSMNPARLLVAALL